MEVGIRRQDWSVVSRPITEASHVAWRVSPLEMTDETKGGAQRASSLSLI
jgi:hypothetical protein